MHGLRRMGIQLINLTRSWLFFYTRVEEVGMWRSWRRKVDSKIMCVNGNWDNTLRPCDTHKILDINYPQYIRLRRVCFGASLDNITLLPGSNDAPTDLFFVIVWNRMGQGLPVIDPTQDNDFELIPSRDVLWWGKLSVSRLNGDGSGGGPSSVHKTDEWPEHDYSEARAGDDLLVLFATSEGTNLLYWNITAEIEIYK